MAKDNSIVWVTGASSGIGKAIASEFTENKKLVVASARDKESLERFKKDIEANKHEIILHPLDVTSNDDVTAAFEKLNENYDIDCLINNAGTTSFKLAEEDDVEMIEKIINTNLLGAIYAIKAVLPAMIERKKGTIINILSVAARHAFTKSSAYAASKAGLLAFTNILREEVREHNIRIINVLPGATRTPIWSNELLEKHGERMMSPAELAKLIYNVYDIKSNMVTEELVIRPIKGDL